MAQWRNTDATGNSVLWAPTNFNKAPNTANRDALYGNTTANAFITGQTVGMFGADVNEVTANRNIPHTGWVIKKTGSGGRANRVQYEVLVAGGISGDESDDATLPDYALFFSTQPSNANASISTDGVAAFGVVARSAPTGATITYQWQYSANANIWANASSSGMSGHTTANLSLNANTVANGYVRAIISSTGGAANVTSNTATYTTTA